MCVAARGARAAGRAYTTGWRADWRRRRRAGTGAPSGISQGNAGTGLDRGTQHPVRNSLQRRRRRSGASLLRGARLVAMKPDAIVANTAPVISALQQQTRTIPIVFVQVLDPVSSGFVESLARPGGNITGFSSYDFGLGAKWL